MAVLRASNAADAIGSKTNVFVQPDPDRAPAGPTGEPGVPTVEGDPTGDPGFPTVEWEQQDNAVRVSKANFRAMLPRFYL